MGTLGSIQSVWSASLSFLVLVSCDFLFYIKLPILTQCHLFSLRCSSLFKHVVTWNIGLVMNINGDLKAALKLQKHMAGILSPFSLFIPKKLFSSLFLFFKKILPSNDLLMYLGTDAIADRDLGFALLVKPCLLTHWE